MADYSRRVVVTERVEYVLPSPTNVAEIMKAYAAAKEDLGKDDPGDNEIQVRAGDDTVIVFIERLRDEASHR